MSVPAQRTAANVGLVILRWTLFAVLLLAFILVPFVLYEGEMNALVEDALQREGSIALITLAVVGFLVADVVLPIPSSFVLTTAGYLLGTGAGTAVCFVGLSCASLAGYALGRYAGGPLAQRIVGSAQLERFADLSSRHGDALLVAFRAMPVLAEATTILAGISRMPLPRFVLIVSIGNFFVSLVYAWIGAVSASQSSFVIAAIAAALLPALIVLAMRRTLQRRDGA